MIIPLYLALCLVLGGASAGGYWANMLLQLLALPLIGVALAREPSQHTSRSGQQLLALLLIGAAIVLAQLTPVPPAVWQELPGRQSIAAGYALLDQPLSWFPVSLAPINTIASALWLLPAVAVLVGIIRLGYFKELFIAWTMAFVAAISVIVGGIQVLAGNDTPFYFYKVTNWGKATGFFANSNHQATLLLISIPMFTALYFHYSRREHSKQRRSGLLVVLVISLLTTAVGLLINASSAGLVLVVPVATATAIAFRERRKDKARRSAPIIVLAVVVTGIAAFGASNSLLMDDFIESEYTVSARSRSVFFANTIEAAGDYFPVGSGVGTFAQIYPRYEDPSAVNRTYTNHAHSDYLELVLEAGLPGLAALALFLFWWCRRTVAIWRSDDVDFFARAAAIASATMLAHSAVDYPLRTAALSAVFAACCALMAAPRARGTRRKRDETAGAPKARHLAA